MNILIMNVAQDLFTLICSTFYTGISFHVILYKPV